jgi:hypothetical protein
MGVAPPDAGLDLIFLVMRGLYARSHQLRQNSEVRLSARIEGVRDRSEQRVAIKHNNPDGYREAVCLVTGCGICRPKSAEVLHMNTNPVLVVARREELGKLEFKPSQ